MNNGLKEETIFHLSFMVVSMDFFVMQATVLGMKTANPFQFTFYYTLLVLLFLEFMHIWFIYIPILIWGL